MGVGQNRKQESERSRQEEVRVYQRLDGGCAEGQEGTRSPGFRRNQERVGTLQEGEGVVQPVSAQRRQFVAFVVIHGAAGSWFAQNMWVGFPRCTYRMGQKKKQQKAAAAKKKKEAAAKKKAAAAAKKKAAAAAKKKKKAAAAAAKKAKK